jgi:alkylation response protein AidB-like acyl-CoA dehydrogenase
MPSGSPNAGAPLERARAIAAVVREDAAEGERLGRLSDRVADALLGSGLFAMLTPKAAGGDDCGRAAFFEAVEAIAEADGAAGWCLSVCASMNDFLYRALPDEGRAEVFGAGPTACWASLLPRASATEAPGGFRLSGAFSMGSGSSLASWVTVSEPLPDRDGRQWFRAHVARKADVVIDPTSWDSMGLRGTASIEYVIRDAFIPARRTFEYPFVQGDGDGPVSTQYGAQLNQIGLTAFASGLGRRAEAELVASASATRRLLADGRQADDAVIQFGLGELDGRIRAARSHFLSLLAAQDAHVAETGALSSHLSAETAQAAQTLARAAREMVIFAFDNAGSSVVMAAHPLQRCLRDIFTGLKHAAFTPAILTRVGKSRLGVPSDFSRIR